MKKVQSSVAVFFLAGGREVRRGPGRSVVSSGWVRLREQYVQLIDAGKTILNILDETTSGDRGW